MHDSGELAEVLGVPEQSTSPAQQLASSAPSSGGFTEIENRL
jgi:hypothetical protein